MTTMDFFGSLLPNFRFYIAVTFNEDIDYRIVIEAVLFIQVRGYPAPVELEPLVQFLFKEVEDVVFLYPLGDLFLVVKGDGGDYGARNPRGRVSALDDLHAWTFFWVISSTSTSLPLSAFAFTRASTTEVCPLLKAPIMSLCWRTESAMRPGNESAATLQRSICAPRWGR